MRYFKFLGLLIFISLNSCNPTKNTASKPADEILKSSKWETLAPNLINLRQQNKGQDMCDRILSTCNTSSFKAFTKQEATPELIEKITPEKLAGTCKEILKGYGKFKKTVFKEAQILEKDGLTCYVFECVYEKKYYKKQIKIIFNESNQATNIVTETIQ